MAGMEFDFTGDTAGLVAALEAAIGPAEELDHALKADRDAAAELGAAGGEAAAGLAAQSAAMDAAAVSTRRLRDEHGLLHDELGRFTRASETVDRSVRGLGDGFREQERTTDDAAQSMAEMEEASRRMGRSLELGALTAGNGLNDLHFKVQDAHQAVADAERGIDDLQHATSRSEVASIAAAHGLKDIEQGGRAATSAVSDLDSAASTAASASGGLGELGSAAMPAAIVAGVTAIAAAAPSLVAAGLGFGAFGALAAPALMKVKTGLSDVNYARQQYQLAKGVEARDPSKANLEAEQRDLAALKTTYAQMPAPVRQTVGAVHELESAWSKASESSGIQKAALHDVTSALNIAKDAIPDVTTLAKAAEKPIAGLERTLDRGIKSKGFTDFVHRMAKEEKPAVKSLTGLGGAIAGFFGHTMEKLAPISPKFIDSLTHLTHSFGPGATKGLATAATDLTRIDNALASKGSMSTIHGLEGLGKASFSGLSTLASGIDQVGKAFHLMGQDTAGLGTADKIINWVNQHAPGKGSNIATKGFNLVTNPEGDLTETAIDHFTRGQGSVRGKALRVPVIPVLATGGKGVEQLSQSLSHAGGGKGIDIKGKVTLSGLAQGIQTQIAHLKLPDSKVKINVSMAGVAGVKGQMHSVVGAAQHDAAAAKAALQSLGPAGSAAGAALDAGLAGGIRAGEGAVVAAASQVASAAAAAVKAAAEIHSPSKVWERLGKEMPAGLVVALEGGKAEVAAAARALGINPFRDASITGAIKKLRKDVREAFTHKDIGAGKRDELLTWIESGNNALMGLAKRRAHLVAEIRAATALAKSVRQGAIGYADITGIAQNDSAGVAAAANPPSTPASIQAGQKSDLHSIRTFTKDIRQLKKEGLDKQSIKELLAQGVSGGLPAAQQLLQSGKAGVKESAKLQREILAASKKLGIEGANAAYESGSQIDKGLAAGLKGELNTVVRAIADMARKLENELRKALGLPPLKGGSGGHGGSGHGGGVHGGGPGGQRFTPGGGHLFDHGGGHTMHGRPIVIHQHHTTTVVLDGQKVGQTMQSTMLRHGRRNVAVGLKPVNRAA